MPVHRHLLPLALLVAVAAAPFPSQPAAASCAGSYLEGAADLVLERGERGVVEGRSFVDGCRDTQSCTGVLGCQSCSYDEPPEVPLEDVRLWLVQGERKWLLDVADAGSAEDNRSGWVTWTFDVPGRAEPGPARLRADGSPAVRITIL